MSLDFNIGFRSRPNLAELDFLMNALGFEIEEHRLRHGNSTRIYNFYDPFFQYEHKIFGIHTGATLSYNKNDRPGSEFGVRKLVLRATALLTAQVDLANRGELDNPDISPKEVDDLKGKIIQEHDVFSTYSCYKHLLPQRLKWYETALTLRDFFNAVVVRDEHEINPSGYFGLAAEDERRKEVLEVRTQGSETIAICNDVTFHLAETKRLEQNAGYLRFDLPETQRTNFGINYVYLIKVGRSIQTNGFILPQERPYDPPLDIDKRVWRYDTLVLHKDVKKALAGVIN